MSSKKKCVWFSKSALAGHSATAIKMENRFDIAWPVVFVRDRKLLSETEQSPDWEGWLRSPPGLCS